MRSLYTALIISAVGLSAAACGDKKPDTANQDFLQPSSNGAVVSPQELGLRDSLSPAVPAAPVVTPVATAPTHTTPVHHTVHHRSSGSSASSSGSIETAPAPVYTPTEHKHTGRDAAIGAGAGAVIGGVTHGIGGAVVGGVVGGVLGGVIGNNVDKSKH